MHWLRTRRGPFPVPLIPAERIHRIPVGITPHGLWLIVDDRERFLPFELFPWFGDASVKAILNVDRPHPHHLHWPDLDVDLHLDSIDDPESYPLVSDPMHSISLHLRREITS